MLINGKWEWLLVTAKADVGELGKWQGSGAKSQKSCRQIETFFNFAINNLGISANAKANEWMDSYYRDAKLIAMLDFMMQRGETARLVFIYFYGDAVNGKKCPQSEKEWQVPLADQSQYLGLSGHKWEKRVHRIFIPVAGV